MQKSDLFKRLKHGLVVSCQALKDEPLHSPFIMSKMALAAKEGGAVGIRANGGEDIRAIKAEVDLPIIGIVKRDYEDSEVFITPTMDEVEEVVKTGADIVAMDATNRMRPRGESLQNFIGQIKRKHPDILLMADVSNLDEAVTAGKLGFDLVATTLSGNTKSTADHPKPNLLLVRKIAEHLDVPVVAEGGIWDPGEMQEAFEYGAFTCIIGTAITRPQEITKRFVDQIQILTSINEEGK